jgi:hypothetical protein
MRTWIVWASLVLITGTAVAQGRSGRGTWGVTSEEYHLNAQYRGTVKKGFSDIGQGGATYTPLGNGQFNVRLNGTVRHPENRDTYEFKVDMDFQIRGSDLRILQNRSQYNARAAEYRGRVERVVPFAFLVKYTPVPASGSEPAYSYRFNGTDYVMRYAPTERHIEASLYDGDSMVGKFFLRRDARTPPLVFEKFRVPAEQDVVFSFIRQ